MQKYNQVNHQSTTHNILLYRILRDKANAYVNNLPIVITYRGFSKIIPWNAFKNADNLHEYKPCVVRPFTHYKICYAVLRSPVLYLELQNWLNNIFHYFESHTDYNKSSIKLKSCSFYKACFLVSLLHVSHKRVQ